MGLTRYLVDKSALARLHLPGVREELEPLMMRARVGQERSHVRKEALPCLLAQSRLRRFARTVLRSPPSKSVVFAGCADHP